MSIESLPYQTKMFSSSSETIKVCGSNKSKNLGAKTFSRVHCLKSSHEVSLEKKGLTVIERVSTGGVNKGRHERGSLAHQPSLPAHRGNSRSELKVFPFSFLTEWRTPECNLSDQLTQTECNMSLIRLNHLTIDGYRRYWSKSRSKLIFAGKLSGKGGDYWCDLTREVIINRRLSSMFSRKSLLRSWFSPIIVNSKAI